MSLQIDSLGDDIGASHLVKVRGTNSRSLLHQCACPASFRQNAIKSFIYISQTLPRIP